MTFLASSIFFVYYIWYRFEQDNKQNFLKSIPVRILGLITVFFYAFAVSSFGQFLRSLVLSGIFEAILLIGVFIFGFSGTLSFVLMKSRYKKQNEFNSKKSLTNKIKTRFLIAVCILTLMPTGLTAATVFLGSVVGSEVVLLEYDGVQFEIPAVVDERFQQAKVDNKGLNRTLFLAQCDSWMGRYYVITYAGNFSGRSEYINGFGSTFAHESADDTGFKMGGFAPFGRVCKVTARI